MLIEINTRTMTQEAIREKLAKYDIRLPERFDFHQFIKLTFDTDTGNCIEAIKLP